MSFENKSASETGHFTASPSERQARRMKLDGYLMLHANRSLPLVRLASAKETLRAVAGVSSLREPKKSFILGHTGAGFAAGELIVKDDILTLRATNSLSRHDTAYRFTTNPGMAMERFTVPAELAATPIQAIDLDGVSVGLDMSGNPTLLLSVLKTASLLCRFALEERLRQEL